MEITEVNKTEIEEKIKLLHWLKAITKEEFENFIKLLIDKNIIPNVEYNFIKRIYETGVVELINTLPEQEGNTIAKLYFTKKDCYVYQFGDEEVSWGLGGGFCENFDLCWATKKEWIKYNLSLHKYTKADVKEIKNEIEYELANAKQSIGLFDEMSGKMSKTNQRDRKLIKDMLIELNAQKSQQQKIAKLNEEFLKEL